MGQADAAVPALDALRWPFIKLVHQTRRRLVEEHKALEVEQARLTKRLRAVEDGLSRAEKLLRGYDARPGGHELRAVAAAPEKTAAVLEGDSALAAWVQRRLDHDGPEAARLLKLINTSFFGNRQRMSMALACAARLKSAMGALTAQKALIERELAAIRDAAGVAQATLRRDASRELDELLSDVKRLSAMVPAACAEFGDTAIWDRWQPAEAPGPIHLGYVVPALDDHGQQHGQFGSDEVMPWLYDIRRGLHITYAAEHRDSALAILRSVVVRVLAGFPPGQVRATFFDPVGLGQSFADFLDLADYDAELVGGKVWSSTVDMRDRLQDLTSHIELVIQKYLRGRYKTIDEFNLEAGEIAEPYRVLFLADFPKGMDAELCAQLQRVVESGPRCGVHTVLFQNTGEPLPHGLPPQSVGWGMYRFGIGGPMVYEADDFRLALNARLSGLRGAAMGGSPAEAAIVSRVVTEVGEQGRGAAQRNVRFDQVARMFDEALRSGIRDTLPRLRAPLSWDRPDTWWSGDSTHALAAPIGQSGARDVAVLRFDSVGESSALLVGRPGSGKTTLLHTFLAGLTSIYGPEELELYLIDFKEGVEFKAYAAEGLPHARCIAIESEREFGLSVLEEVVAEMERRGRLFRDTDGARVALSTYRERTGAVLPRVLLVFDEFQLLYSVPDATASRAAELLETLIRQGRGFGIHVLLSSQSLSGMDALDRHILQLVPVRLLLSSAPGDAEALLGEHNDGGSFLRGPGDALLNRQGGAVEANERVQIGTLSEEERLAHLGRLRQQADARGLHRAPLVFEGHTSQSLDRSTPRDFLDALNTGSPLRLRLRSAAGMTLAPGAMDCDLRREPGGNLVGIVPSGELALGLLSAWAHAAVGQATGSGGEVHVVDLMSVEEGAEEVLAPLIDARVLRMHRRKLFGEVIAQMLAEVDRRSEQDLMREPSVTLILFGLHRARESSPEVDATDEERELHGNLLRLLRGGPEVGVHVAVWLDSVAGGDRRLGHGWLREFETRIVGGQSPVDTERIAECVISSPPKGAQLLVAGLRDGTVSKGRAMTVPAAAWSSSLLREMEVPV